MEETILVIDDDAVYLRMMTIALEREGYRLISANHGDIGLKMLRDQQPDLVVVDIAMPGIDGYDVVRRIRAQEREDRHTPIIILTAHARPLMRADAEDLGVDLFLTKPVSLDRLFEHLRTLTTPSVE